MDQLMLSDTQILWRLDAGLLMIDPFDRKNLGPCSYDLKIGRILTKHGEIRTGIISPGTVAALTSKETIWIPANTQTAGLVSMRSGPSREGLLATYSHLVDPGYKGKLNFIVYPLKPIVISLDKSLFQIMFIRTGEITKAWRGDGKKFGETLDESS